MTALDRCIEECERGGLSLTALPGAHIKEARKELEDLRGAVMEFNNLVIEYDSLERHKNELHRQRDHYRSRMQELQAQLDQQRKG